MDFFKYIAYALLIVLAIALYMLYTAYTQAKKENEEESSEIKNDEIIPYRRKHLLTTNEWGFYKNLKEVADKLNLCVLAKVRLADLVEVSAEVDTKEKSKYRNKIKSKHIDFMLCKKENLYPELIIELNDNSHKKDDRAQRDSFVEKVLEKSGYKILFVYGSGDLEEKILNALNSTKKEIDTKVICEQENS